LGAAVLSPDLRVELRRCVEILLNGEVLATARRYVEIDVGVTPDGKLSKDSNTYKYILESSKIEEKTALLSCLRNPLQL
jgi:hypothetical protein